MSNEPTYLGTVELVSGARRVLDDEEDGFADVKTERVIRVVTDQGEFLLDVDDEMVGEAFFSQAAWVVADE